jgi:flagellar motility protein MotE (MotC chaperone)
MYAGEVVTRTTVPAAAPVEEESDPYRVRLRQINAERDAEIRKCTQMLDWLHQSSGRLQHQDQEQEREQEARYNLASSECPPRTFSCV